MRVDLWLWSLRSGMSSQEQDRALLSDDECVRADRFVKQSDRDDYTAGRARLRRLLAAQTGQSAADLEFTYGPQGKPELAAGPAFNLSHSGGMAALAICDFGSVGIDIEAMRPVEEAVAHQFFSARENRALATLTSDQWLAGFYRCWTRKEAVIKAVGQGLSMPLDSFDVTLLADDDPALTRIEGGSARDWQLRSLDIAPGFMGALAVPVIDTALDLNWCERP